MNIFEETDPARVDEEESAAHNRVYDPVSTTQRESLAVLVIKTLGKKLGTKNWFIIFI